MLLQFSYGIILCIFVKNKLFKEMGNRRQQQLSPSNDAEQNYIEAVKAIKQAILQSRYKAAILVNGEMLSLYFGVGKYVSQNSKNGFWGTNAIETISTQLQNELPGLRGFGVSNIKNMRTFYESWCSYFSNRQLPTGDLKQEELNCQLATDDLQVSINELLTFRQSSIGDLKDDFISDFLKVGFTNHSEILSKTKTLEERIFYIRHCANEFWSVETLKYHLRSHYFEKQGRLPNNFRTTIQPQDLRANALMSFKDEYLLDYINIEDPDVIDERVIENEIVRNIKKFIMTLGADFCFIGNQYRLIVDDDEYFVDLLFFNCQLQCLVAIELKRGKFKAEYLGQLNLYLSLLDEYIRRPYENKSIGILLCTEQKKKTVEFALRDFNKPMGVATYKTAEELPEEYRQVFKNLEGIKKIL